MIFEIAKEVTALLRARGVPYDVVVDDAPTTQATFARSRIRLDHTEGDGSDRFSAPRSQRPRDAHRFTRSQGFTLEIYAKSTKQGATPFEHKRLANNVLDQVLVAFDDVAARRKNAWSPTAGGFVPLPDFEGSEKPGGALYRLTFTFDRAVSERDFDGALEPTATFGPGGVVLTSTTKVSLAGASADTSQPPPDAATGCGG